MAEADGHLQVLHRPRKEGLGRAYLDSFRWGLDRGYEVIGEIDADGSHQPEALPSLLAAASSADLVIGSRWVPGGRVENWSRRRQLLSRVANTYARLSLGLPLRDATAGFRVFRRPPWKASRCDDVASQGYCFQIDLARRGTAPAFGCRGADRFPRARVRC